MFRVQTPPLALSRSISDFVKVLYKEFGNDAMLDNELLTFIDILKDEMGHPALIVTRKQMNAAINRALRRAAIERKIMTSLK